MIIKAQVPPSPPKTIKANPNGVKQKKKTAQACLKAVYFLLYTAKGRGSYCFFRLPHPGERLASRGNPSILRNTQNGYADLNYPEIRVIRL